MNTKQRQRGDGLVGILIAAVVFAVGIAAIMQLQGGFFKSTSASHARSIATSIGEDTIETLRSFQAPGPLATSDKDYGSIVDDAGVGITNGALTKDNIVFTRSWEVDDYYYNDTIEKPPITPLGVWGTVQQKEVTVTVAWTDTDGSAQTAVMKTVINQINATAAGGLPVSNPAAGGVKPDIPYTPSTDSKVVPIGVGTDSTRETLVPVNSDPNSGYASTVFTAYTYESSGSNILLREEEFQTIACDCTFDGTGDAYGPSYPKWNTSKKTYIDEEGVLASKVKGVETNKQHIYCDICCRDHHDSSTVSQLYDPYRSSDDFDANGDHKHYNGTNVVTSGQYLESCRLKRVNGFWRVFQDWHMVELTTLPLSDLTTDSTRANYQTYVKDVIDQHLDESKVSGETLTTPPTIHSSLNHNTSGNYVALGAVSDQRQLTARAIFLDFMYDTADNPHLTQVKALKTGSGDYLLHTPFYEVDVTELSRWTSADPSSVLVGLQDSSLDLGLVEGKTTTTGESVTATIKYSNSGVVALNSAVDYYAASNADDETRDSSVKVSVGSGTPTSSTSSTSTTTTTVPTSTTTLATCTTTISGTTAAQNQTPFLVIDSGSPISCSDSGSNKKFKCPTLDISISLGVTITSGGDTKILDPFCNNPIVAF